MKTSIFRTAPAFVVTVLALSACTPTVENRITNTGGGLAGGSAVAMLVPEAPRSAVESKIQPRLEEALTKAGYRIDASAPIVADFSFAARPAGLGIANAAKPVDPKAKADWVSAPRGKGSCKKLTYRLTALFLERESGRTLYRGASEMTLCPVADDVLLPILVDGAVKDAAQPGKAYIVKQRVSG